MSYRITTNGMLRNYQRNLYKNTWHVKNAMEQVQTGRIFNSYMEDPVNASKAFRLRRSYWNAGNQIDNSTYLISKFSTGWNALDQIVDGNADHPGLTGITTALRALNDPSGSARRVLGQEMMSTATSCSMLMNIRNGDTFVFAGADGLNVPFKWSDKGELLYRGFSVNAPKPLSQERYEALYNTADDFSTMEGMEGYDRLAKYMTKNAPAGYGDYETWFADTHPDLTTGMTDAEFNAWKTAEAPDPPDYRGMEKFEQYLVDNGKDVEDPQIEDYRAWIDHENGKLTEDEFKAALNDGDFSKMNGFAEYYVVEKNLKVPEYGEYQEWYVNEYAGEMPENPDIEQMFRTAMIRFDEATYVDIGIGLKFDDEGNVIPSSAFNSALSGLNILGYGTDEDGDSRNALQLMHDLGQLFNACDEDTGNYPESYVYNGVTYTEGEVVELATRLTNKLIDACDRVSEQHVALDSRVNYLKKNQEQLEEYKLDMNEQIETTEQVEMAYSIMELEWVRYCYEAALRIGGSILSHSLLDYMN